MLKLRLEFFGEFHFLAGGCRNRCFDIFGHDRWRSVEVRRAEECIKHGRCLREDIRARAKRIKVESFEPNLRTDGPSRNDTPELSEHYVFWVFDDWNRIVILAGDHRSTDNRHQMKDVRRRSAPDHVADVANRFGTRCAVLNTIHHHELYLSPHQ